MGKFFGMSAAFESFSNDGKELIIQYQAKYEKDIECGGGYVKIGPKMADAKAFGDPTEYNIMFGPDKCGYTKRTHAIFNYKGKNVLKKSDLAYKQDDFGISHLYRMTVKPDNTVKVEVDQTELYSGNMKDDWELLAAKVIPDPDDKKPADWVNTSMGDDAEDAKPDDWVTEKRIVDPKAKRISNPEYKGVWEAKKIDNPEYVDDDAVYKYADFGFIGFDLWQVKAETIFDNVIITDDVAEADKFSAMWKKTNAAETEQKKVADDAKKAEDDAKKADEPKGGDDDDDDDDEEDKEDM